MMRTLTMDLPTLLRVAVLVGVVISAGIACGSSSSNSGSTSGSSAASATTATAQPPSADTLREQAQQVCARALQASVPATAGSAKPSVLAMRNKDDETTPAGGRVWIREYLQSPQEAKLASEVRSLVCINETRTLVGTYQQSNSRAYRRDWEARLVSWPDGAILRMRKFDGEPPPQERSLTSRTDVYGNEPTKALKDWLATVLVSQ